LKNTIRNYLFQMV